MPAPEKRKVNTGFPAKLFPILIFATVFIFFKGALKNGFVEWDDGDYVLRNLFIQSFSLDNIREMFTNSNTGNWHPVTWISHAIDYHFFGLNPVGHHFTGIILHSINAVWVYLLFLRLTSRVQPGWANGMPLYLGGLVAALLYGCHPLRVESVVWASERKDLLSAFFILPAFLAYLSYTGTQVPATRKRWYLIVTGLFILALLSKPMVVTFPVTLLILDVFLLNRITDIRKFLPLIWEKIPLFLLSFIFGIIAIFSQKGAGAMAPLDSLGLVARLLNAVRAMIFYINKTLWPDSLVPVYPFPTGLRLVDPGFYLAFAALSGLSLFCYWMWKRGRPVWLAVWLYYILTVMPVIGILQVGRQGAADRYTYLPTLSFYFLAGAGIVWLLQNFIGTSYSKRCVAFVLVVGGLTIGGLGFLTNMQIGIWKNSETLWRWTMMAYPHQVPMAHFKMARIYNKEGRRDKAKQEFLTALEINPNYTLPLNDLGLMAMEEGRLDEAESYFRSGLALSPDNVFHTNLGNLFMRRKQFQLAKEHLLNALKVKPDYSDAHNNLGMVYLYFDKFKLAEDHYKSAIKYRPRFMQALANLGILYKNTGHLSKAEVALTQALEIDPANPDILNALGEVYLKAGLIDQAIKEFKVALKFNPGHALAKAHLNRLLPPVKRTE